MITWYRCGQSTFSSCHHMATQRKAKMDKSTTGQKAPKDQNQGGQNPQKWEKYFKTATIKVYDNMITWYRCGQSTFSSCHHMAAQRKAKMDKSTTGQKPQGSESRRIKPPKMRKYFKTPTIKVYDPMITWYRCGQSTFSSCHHVATQRKAKIDKSTTGQKPQSIQNLSSKALFWNRPFQYSVVKLQIVFNIVFTVGFKYMHKFTLVVLFGVLWIGPTNVAYCRRLSRTTAVYWDGFQVCLMMEEDTRLYIPQ